MAGATLSRGAGNNEIKILKRGRPWLRFFAREEAHILRRADLLDFIRSWPLVVDFPNEGIAAVHGGFLPQMQVTPEDVERYRDDLTKLRWIREEDGQWRAIPKDQKRRGDVLWAEQWRGDRFVLYGHTPVREPRRDARSLGLDTGCVYGGALTAAVHAVGEWETVSVKAKRNYAE